MSQTEIIGKFLRKHKKIDNFYSIDRRLSLRLAARIKDLRYAKWEIVTLKKGKNTVYKLIKAPKV
jgi:hypothetical protein